MTVRKTPFTQQDYDCMNSKQKYYYRKHKSELLENVDISFYVSLTKLLLVQIVYFLLNFIDNLNDDIDNLKEQLKKANKEIDELQIRIKVEGVPIEKIVEVIRYIEKPIERTVEVIKYVEKPVEIVKEVPIEKIVEVIKYIEKTAEAIESIEKPVEIVKEVQIEKRVKENLIKNNYLQFIQSIKELDERREAVVKVEEYLICRKIKKDTIELVNSEPQRKFQIVTNFNKRKNNLLDHIIAAGKKNTINFSQSEMEFIYKTMKGKIHSINYCNALSLSTGQSFLYVNQIRDDGATYS